MSGRVWPLVLALCLAGCADTTFEEPNTRALAPFFTLIDKKAPQKTAGEIYLEDEEDVYRPMQELDLAAREDEREYERKYGVVPSGGRLGLEAPEPPVPVGCSLKDRFDRGAALAYNFDDQQTRLSLHLSGDAGFGGFDMEKVMVKYTYKLQPIPHRKDKCKYKSNWQGLIPSAYHELHVRQKNTVWDQLRDENPLGLFD